MTPKEIRMEELEKGEIMNSTKSPLEKLLVDRNNEETMTPEQIKELVDEEETRHALPEGQQKEEWDEDEDSLPAIIAEAEELTNEMFDVRYRTNSDGTIEGIVKKIHHSRKNHTIAIDIDLPAEDELERFHFKKPKSWTYDYDFVRFIEGYGHRASTITEMIEKGVKVKLKRVDDEYQLVLPSTMKTKSHWVNTVLRNPLRQNHFIWKAIPILSGFSFAFTYASGPIFSNINTWAEGYMIGLAIMFVVGLVELFIGESFLGWGDD